MSNDNLDPVIEKYRRELVEFSQKNPKFADESVNASVPDDKEEAVFTQLITNVASREEETNDPVEEGQNIRDELMFAENAEKYPPYNNGTLKQYRNIEEFLVDNPRSGFLRVQVFAGEQTFPVSNANVIITKSFGDRENVFYEEHTDSSGIMSRITLPAPDKSLSIYPSSLQPYSTYDILVTHPGFNRVAIKNCVVFDGIETSQLVEMIPEILKNSDTNGGD
ncbi:MAG: hypothetical protein IJB86_10145 [Clostridia bacterium]|nr:hypothetical protein [Clostridia bacterium]